MTEADSQTGAQHYCLVAEIGMVWYYFSGRTLSQFLLLLTQTWVAKYEYIILKVMARVMTASFLGNTAYGQVPLKVEY